MNPLIGVFLLETSETNRTSNHTTLKRMYRTNRERIGASRILVVRAIYARTVDFDNIITAYHQLANTLECTGYKAEAAIIDQIISGYERLRNLTATPNTNPFSDAAGKHLRLSSNNRVEACPKPHASTRTGI
jgi:hypothetical protein